MRKTRKGGKKLQKNHLTRISKTRRMCQTRKHNKRKTKHLKKSIKHKLYGGGKKCDEQGQALCPQNTTCFQWFEGRNPDYPNGRLVYRCLSNRSTTPPPKRG